MKTIEQLLFLSKNPYYKLTEEEKQVLNDFLSKKQAKTSTSSRKKNSKRSTAKTNVRVKNIVEKTDTYPVDSREYERQRVVYPDGLPDEYEADNTPDIENVS